MSFGNLFMTFTAGFLLYFGPLDRIQKAIDKGEFEKAEELIQRGYLKEPNNPGIPFYHALILFEPQYSKYNPDSARKVVSRSLDLFQSIDDELLEDLIEDGVEEERVVALSNRIRKYHFDNALDELSLSSINDFRINYPGSPFDDLLIFKRDSIEFDEAKRVNTIDGYVAFIDAYPTTIFMNQADSLLDGLRFLKLETTGNLQDYYNFLNKYPNTSEKTTIQQHILNVSTSSHEPGRYIDFIRFSSNIRLKKRAADFLYYISPEEAMQWHPFKDSLRNTNRVKKVAIFPTMDRDRFGFHNEFGTSQISYQYDEIQEHLKCETTKDDWLFVKTSKSGMIVTKLNQVVVNDVSGYSELGDGLAILQKENKKYLYHKSGFKILNYSIQSAEVLQSKWIKAKVNDKWGLYTFSGVPIAEARYEDIYVLGDFWVFEKDGLLGVYTEEHILNEIENKGLSLEFKFEDLELVSDSLLIGFRGDRECLLDSDLHFLVPWGSYEIHPDPSRWYLRSANGYQLYNNTDERIIDRIYPYLESNDGWLALKTEEGWMLIPRSPNMQPTRGYDSIKLITSNAALVIEEENKELHFSNGNMIAIDDESIETFYRNSEYLSIKKEDALSIYNSLGEKIITGEFDDVSLVNDTLIKVSVKGKQGVISLDGNYLIDAAYDALNEKDGLVQTLRKGKIGSYDLKNQQAISTNFESRIERIGNYYLAKSDGKYGIIDSEENEIISFQYDQIELWNDTSYLVTDENQYMVIDADEQDLIEPITEITLLFERLDERVFKFVRDGKLGLVSSKNGFLLEAEFTDIVNIGSKASPLFFADQHLDKAGFHVVSYVNELGELIFSKAYRKEEFDRILCED